MSFEGRLSLTPLPIDKEELSSIGELLSNKNDGVLYIKLNDGSVVPIKGDSYFRFKKFYDEFWNTGDTEPEDPASFNWLNTNGYEENMEDLSAVVMIQVEDENGDLKWKALSPHSKASSVYIDKETSESLDEFVARHDEFYKRAFDVTGNEPDMTDPNARKHWIKDEGLRPDDNIISGAIMMQSDSDDWLALSPTVLAEDVVVDLENDFRLDDVLPEIYSIKSDLETFMELRDKIQLAADLEERVERNEYGIIHAHDFTKDEIAALREELTQLLTKEDHELDSKLSTMISDLEKDVGDIQNVLQSNINSLDSEIKTRLVELQMAIDEHDTQFSNHETKRILDSPVHGMRVNSTSGKLEYAISPGVWVSVISEDRMGEPEGVATLNSDGIVPNSQLPSVLSPQIFIVSDLNARSQLTPDHGDECYVIATSKRYIWDANENFWLSRSSNDNLFEVSWEAIPDKPTEFKPEIHGSEAHDDSVITVENLEEKLNTLGYNSSPFMNSWGGM